MKKKIALGLAVLSGAFLVVPEPANLTPIIGWLDEGMALALFAWSLRTLGVTPATIFRRLRGVGAAALPESSAG
jgi:hypothetical protein